MKLNEDYEFQSYYRIWRETNINVPVRNESMVILNVKTKKKIISAKEITTTWMKWIMGDICKKKISLYFKYVLRSLYLPFLYVF